MLFGMLQLAVHGVVINRKMHSIYNPGLFVVVFLHWPIDSAASGMWSLTTWSNGGCRRRQSPGSRRWGGHARHKLVCQAPGRRIRSAGAMAPVSTCRRRWRGCSTRRNAVSVGSGHAGYGEGSGDVLRCDLRFEREQGELSNRSLCDAETHGGSFRHGRPPEEQHSRHDGGRRHRASAPAAGA